MLQGCKTRPPRWVSAQGLTPTIRKASARDGSYVLRLSQGQATTQTPNDDNSTLQEVCWYLTQIICLKAFGMLKILCVNNAGTLPRIVMPRIVDQFLECHIVLTPVSGG